jgi:hypothetical protein
LSDRISRREEALKLAKKLRDSLLDEEKNLSTLLLGCKTVCRYLGNLDENIWIENELNGYDVTQFSSYAEQEQKLPEHRKINLLYFYTNNNPVVGLSVEDAEQLCLSKIPNPVTDIETSDILTFTSGRGIEVMNYFCSQNGLPPVYKAVAYENSIHTVIVAIKNVISEFLDKIILEIEYGGIPEGIFENIRKQVDEKMVLLCPDAINKLKVTYENVSTGATSESWSHVASSCRRILKDVADAIFPPQSQPITIDGKEHSVDDRAYLNRIRAGLKKSEDNTTNDFTMSMFSYVDGFLKNIQAYASKGDHSVFSKTDASRCVVYTYMVLGDILNYYINS